MKLFFYLLTLFIVIPFVELLILFRIAGSLGAFKGVVLIVITGVIGAHLAKQQGLKVIHTIRYELSHGRLPGSELIDGLIILIAGIVLITPGLLTDTAGFLLLVPICRKWIYSWLFHKFKEKIRTARITFPTASINDSLNNDIKNDENIIDVEVEDPENGNS